CGLAVTSTGVLYVSERATGEVLAFKPSAYPFSGTPPTARKSSTPPAKPKAYPWMALTTASTSPKATASPPTSTTCRRSRSKTQLAALSTPKEGLPKLVYVTGERRAKRGKDARRPNSSAIWPTEDAAAALGPPPPGAGKGFGSPSCLYSISSNLAVTL